MAPTSLLICLIILLLCLNASNYLVAKADIPVVSASSAAVAPSKLMSLAKAEAEAEPPSSPLSVVKEISKHPIDQRSSSNSPSPLDAMPTDMKEQHHHRHHHSSSYDKSIVGAGVILGGLATAFIVAIFCYIRATRRQKAVIQLPPASPVSSSPHRLLL